MKTYKNLYTSLTSYENLEKAFDNAKKGKSPLSYVIEFEKNLEENLLLLRYELEGFTYKPKPLRRFIVRDPKTRTIHSSVFKDRIIHHALCNIIEPIFEKRFIYDSYANRLGKGTLKAIERFDYFKKIVSRNNTIRCYVLKADIRKYFENIEHDILLLMIKRQIAD